MVELTAEEKLSIAQQWQAQQEAAEKHIAINEYIAELSTRTSKLSKEDKKVALNEEISSLQAQINKP